MSKSKVMIISYFNNGNVIVMDENGQRPDLQYGNLITDHLQKLSDRGIDIFDPDLEINAIVSGIWRQIVPHLIDGVLNIEFKP